MKDGVRIVNCARGELIDLDALEAALESRQGRRRRPRRLPGRADDRAPDLRPRRRRRHPAPRAPRPPRPRTAPGSSPPSRCVAALTGGVVTNAVNIPAVRPETMEALAPFVPLCEKLGRLAQGLGNGSIDRVEVEVRGRLAEHDTRLLGISTLVGILAGHTEEPVNLVNAPSVAEDARHRAGRDHRHASPRTSPS